MTVQTSSSGIGVAVRRTEDGRFLLGKGHYTDDIALPGQAYLYILRSPRAHATIKSIAAAGAEKAPGVVAVYTSADLAALGGLPCGWLIHNKDGSPMREPKHPVLAEGKVRHVGDPVAAVIAETYAQARDAAELIDVDYGELPAVVDMAAAVAGAPALHDAAPDNICFDWHLGDADAVRDGLRKRRARHAAGTHQQPRCPQCHRAAVRYRRLQQRHRRAYPLHH